MTNFSADAAKYALPSKPAKALTLVDKANELVSIREIYTQMTGSYVPDGQMFSWKIHCPFEFEHSDGGLDKNTRIYDSNTIYCFGMHGVIRPVYLYARWKGIPTKLAAEELLKERGLLEKKGYRARWNDLMELREEKFHQRLGEQSYAIDALQKSLENDRMYVENEYAEDVRSAWVISLAKLDVLWSRPETTAASLTAWLHISKDRIKKAALEVEE